MSERGAEVLFSRGIKSPCSVVQYSVMCVLSIESDNRLQLNGKDSIAALKLFSWDYILPHAGQVSSGIAIPLHVLLLPPPPPPCHISSAFHEYLCGK